MVKMQHPTNNIVVGAPKGWNQKKLECSALALTLTDWEGYPACVSWWQPTEEEKKLIAEGKPVQLWVAGTERTHPPVALTVGD